MSTEDDDGLMEFVDEDPDLGSSYGPGSVWRVLIIDDEEDVHSATTFALRSTEVVGRPLEFLHATNAREAKQTLQDNDDIAVILLDVVMETPNAGLDLVPVIRNELKIKDTRIILRTGQPNQAPEIEVIRDYDINDYKLKSELTQARLFASLTTAIRSYKQIHTIEAGKKSLSLIVKSSAELLTQKGVHDFAEGVIYHLSGLLGISPEGLICVRREERRSEVNTEIIAAAGHYSPLIDMPLENLNEQDAQNTLIECLEAQKNIFNHNGIALYLGSKERGDMACFVSNTAEFSEIDESLLELFCGNISICADNRALVTRLSKYAYTDQITELPNRNALLEAINKDVDKRTLNENLLCMVDIDNFADINVALGQSYGDQLLKVIGKRLQARFPEPCLVARVAGDIFAIFGPSASINQEKLMTLFASPFDIEGEEQIISATAGIVPLSEVQGRGNEAIKDATIALKTAKVHHRGQTVVYKADMVKDAQGRLGMLRHLRSAFEHNQLYLEFQPKLRLSDMAVTGFESLIRWKNHEGRLVSPSEFIPLAEQSGFIVKLGAWIFKHSIYALADFHKRGWRDCHMSINLSVAQLRHPGILSFLDSVVTEEKLDPKYVNLEITETLAVSDLDATVELLNKIKKLGFSLSLDDFGTGYSSLNHLQKMPIDYLKVDKSLVSASMHNGGREIIEMIVHLAGRLNLEVVAEGVEDSGQIEFLKSLNCDHAQGFYYAKPMKKDELYEWMSNQENRKL